MNNNINITKILLLVFLCTISFSANAQKVGELFLSMPDKILPTLSKQQRFEMLEYSKLNRRDSVRNKFNEYVSIQHYDSINQLITFNTTKNNLTETKIFEMENGSAVVAVINTVLQPVRLSTIQFYNTTNWQPMLLFTDIPTAKQWLISENTENADIDLDWLNKHLGNSYLSFTFSKEKPAIEVENHLVDFLSIEDKKIIANLLSNKPLIYKLSHKQFVISE